MRPDTTQLLLDEARTERIAAASATIAFLTRVQSRLAERGALTEHLEWAKEAAWAAAYPGSPDDSLLNGLDTEAENAR